jgi:hypothetical protein
MSVAVYQVTNKSLLDNYAVLQCLTWPDVLVGQQITVAGVDATFNGSFTIVDTPQYAFIGVNDQGELMFNGSDPVPNQILYAKTASNVDLVAASGTVTYNPVCTWVTGAEVQTWLGIPLAGDDETAFLTQCASAASQFIWRRRTESGYTGDSLSTAPTADVKLATVMYGGALYRQRGSIDQFASFTEMGSVTVAGLSPIIKQLAGLGRPQVA